MRRFLAPIALGLACGACKSGEPTAEPPPAASASRTERFGAPLSAADAVPLTRILENPDEYADRAVTVEGKVRRNCTRKGCWMELAESEDPKAPGCRVTFKDYGFFVPLDSAGSTAKVQGAVLSKVVSAREVEHLESEGGSFPNKQPDGTAREVRIVATGVELRRPDS